MNEKIEQPDPELMDDPALGAACIARGPQYYTGRREAGEGLPFDKNKSESWKRGYEDKIRELKE